MSLRCLFPCPHPTTVRYSWEVRQNGWLVCGTGLRCLRCGSEAPYIAVPESDSKFYLPPEVVQAPPCEVAA